MTEKAPKPEEPDDPVRDFENDEESIREERTREAGLTAFGGPVFGGLFGRSERSGPLGEDSGGDVYDAEHNP